MTSLAAKKLVGGVAATGVANVVSRAALPVMTVALAQMLRPGELGGVAFALSLAAVLSSLSDFGLTVGLQKFVPQEDDAETFIQTAVIVRAGFALIVALLVVTVDIIWAGARGYGYYVAAIVLCSVLELAGIVLNARTNFVGFAIVQAATPLVFLTGSVGLVLAGLSVSGPLASRAVSVAIVGAPVIYFLLRGKRIVLSRIIAQRMITFGFFAMLITLSSSLFNQADVILIGYLRDDSSAGVYKVAVTLATLPSGLGVLVSTPLLPILSQLVRATEWEQAARLVRTTVRYLAYTGIPLVIGGWVLAPSLVGVLFPAGYLGAIWPFRILLLANFLGLVPLPLVSLLYVNGNERYLAKIALVSAVLNVVGNLVLIPMFGLIGAAVASLVSYAVGLVLELLWCRAHLPVAWEWARYLRFTAAGVIMAITLWILASVAVSPQLILVICLSGASAYVATSILVQGVSYSDLRKLWSLSYGT